ncbi:MAG: hypothetical protein CVU51_01010 [Deltaproteobacteria bacterium HGW-Deltaproteobacteria-1]|nr:MAG: hypothetical protein CVU51_01010 [Deltaproteobacteria bacterium HGW-Deltaproteobacteria-1]
MCEDCNDYKSTTDEIKSTLTIDPKMRSVFFDSYESSYPWYIIRHEDGTFESVIEGKISERDKKPVEHTSNCVSTHQGRHIMEFADATYDSGVLILEISGGMPAYFSSLRIIVKGVDFLCRFKGVYPAPVSNCKRNIIAKKLVFKDREIKKGRRLFAWVSVEFEETSTYQGVAETSRHKIEGYIKPVVK